MTSPPLREGIAEDLVSALKVSFKDIIDFSFVMVITFHANANTTTTNTSDMISTQAGFSADGAGGSGLPAEGTCALSRALTQRISQKIVLDSSRERERKPLSTCRGPNLSTPTSMTTSTWRDFPAPNVGAVTREVGTVWLVYPTILLELAKGETDDLGYATKRLVLIFCTLFLPDPNLAWGRGKMGEMGERGEEDWDLLGNSSHP